MRAVVLAAIGLVIAGCASHEGVVGAASSSSSGIPRSASQRSVDNAGRRPVQTPAPCLGKTCWVAVSVATLWAKPSYPRSLDAPAIGNPAYPRAWIGSLTNPEKRWLTGRAPTQAIYGTEVRVVGRSGAWMSVVVPSQPSNLDVRGYPGWVPARQLTGSRPVRAAMSAVVRSRTTWLRSGWSGKGPSGSRLMEVSYDTRLPVIRVTPAYVLVRLLGGRPAALAPGAAAVATTGRSPTARRNTIVNDAKAFLGLPYLWGGTSGFGFDCSGLTYAVFGAVGVTLPRDAGQQAVHGTPVQRHDLVPGDLVFFRANATGPVEHVGLYIGNGLMINARHTGAAVETDQVSSLRYYAGARRYLAP